jgi:large subunit ribosomal protein L4
MVGAVRLRLEEATTMPVVPVYNLDKKEVGSQTLDDGLFAAEVKEHLFHEVVRARLAARRAGTADTKERSEVAGSTKKIWKQKGTGRARHGSKKAPNFVGGGTVFGPHPRSYALKVNKKVRAAALASALTRRLSEKALFLIDDLSVAQIKTKQVVGIMGRFQTSKALFVDVQNDRLELSVRNLPNAAFVQVGSLNVYDILRHDHLLISKKAVAALEERSA